MNAPDPLIYHLGYIAGVIMRSKENTAVRELTKVEWENILDEVEDHYLAARASLPGGKTTKTQRVRLPNEAGNLGKYDMETETIASVLNAGAVGLCVVGGVKGGGFSLTVADNPEKKKNLMTIVVCLEVVAKRMREQLAQNEN